jgi:hypothetical protein
MASDQDVDTAGTEADDESVTSKTHGFGEHAPDTSHTTIPDEQAADDDPSPGAGVRDTGDKGGVS